MIRRNVAIPAALVLALALPAAASAEYVRDGLRINLRSQPGQQYRIVKTLASGDQVARLAEVENWIQVRVDNGERTTGWVPKGYLTATPPASVSLPRVKTRLDHAQSRVTELEAALGEQATTITEIETLRSENTLLKTENMQLSGSERWRSLGMGAVIALGGILVGVLWPRGGARNARRIKL
ncbi:MAG: TIGR04211 family SH3 domain-containing protein [Deltaproteobacteria bacterium]|nr:TIGR04211 family SH3 domain-containing protein [Deltaproteobacteria bacterium]MBW2414182.1 TIGR04211 family SH3 domain-containing protein [Deltaproteobacteria bacterium]